MIVYHGTTKRRADRICVEGFLPKKPSKRVWFAKGHGYALGRARTQARRSHDRPVVLTCELRLDQMRIKYGTKRIMQRGGVIAIDAPVPVTVLRSHPGAADQPTTPKELATWINELLRLKSHKGVSPRHEGVSRLSRWVVNRLATQSRSLIGKPELVEMARRWLPEFFDGVVVDPEQLHASRKVETIEVGIHVEPPEVEAHERDDEALECLVDPKPKQRIRGLTLLAETGDPDLFDWCAMYLGDESTEVRVAALHTMQCCETGDPEAIKPLVDSEDRRVRGAAIAALVKHSGKEAPRWAERGLKDPEPCVRLEAAALLADFDSAKHLLLFELALHDLNPNVVRRAETITGKKGHHLQRPARGLSKRRI